MSESFFRRLTNIAGIFLLTAVFGLLIFIANVEIKDLDLWFHIGAGRYIVQHGFHVPSVDVFSCTIAGQPWVNHEWLFQVIVYYLYTFFGADGLINMQVVLVGVTTLLLLLLGYNKEKQLGSIFILLLTTLVYHSRFTIRPDLFSLLFFTLYIFVLAFYLNRKWSIFFLFFVQILWTNIHGFFFFGPLFVSIGLFAEWTKRHVKLPYEWNQIGRLEDDEYRRLKWILGAVIVACLFNPLTFKGAWYPIGVFFHISGKSNQIFFEKIVELKKPITMDNIFDMGRYPYYKLMIVLSFCSMVFNRRKLDISTVIFWLIFLLFSLAAVRNLVFFSFAAYLVFSTNMLSIDLDDIVPLEITDKKFIYMASLFAKIFLVVWILQYVSKVSLNGYFDFDKYERKSEFGGVSLRQYPYKAVNFLTSNHIKGNFFNDFNSGAYLVGKTSPDIKVFIDGRTEVYGSDFFRYYESVWEKGDEKTFESMLNKYNMTGVFLNTVQQPAPEPVMKYLEEKKEWIPVYFDYDGLIYLKDIPQNKPVIEQYRIDFEQYQPKQLDLYRLGSKNVDAYQHVNRAYSLESMDYHQAALGELREALRVNPDYKAPYKIMGRVYARMKDFQKAFEYFRLAVIFDPFNKRLRKNLAETYFDLEKYNYAVEQYKKIIEAWPDDDEAYYLLARTYIKDQEFERGLKTLRKAYQMNPDAVGDVLILGDLLAKQGEYDFAQKVYFLALGSGKQLAKIHLKLGIVYRKLGLNQKAEESLLESYKLDMENPLTVENLKELGIPIPE